MASFVPELRKIYQNNVCAKICFWINRALIKNECERSGNLDESNIYGY